MGILSILFARYRKSITQTKNGKSLDLFLQLRNATAHCSNLISENKQYSGHFFQRLYKAFRACLSRIELFYQG
jgi:hypothetical protein